MQRFLNGLTNSRINLQSLQPLSIPSTTPNTNELSFSFLTEGRFTSRNTLSVLLRTPSEMSLQFSRALSALSKGFYLTISNFTYTECFQLYYLTKFAKVGDALLYLHNYHIQERKIPEWPVQQFLPSPQPRRENSQRQTQKGHTSFYPVR